MALFSGKRKQGLPSPPGSPPMSTDDDTLAGVEALLSRYENHRPLEVSCVSTEGSRRASVATSICILDSLEGILTDNMLAGGYRGSQAELPSFEALHAAPARASLFIRDEKPSTWVRTAKHFYDKYRLRNYAPFILLFLYSLLGAFLFHSLESDHEKQLMIKEQRDLEQLRNVTFTQLFRLVRIPSEQNGDQASKILETHEKELQRIKLPDHINWDMWGAMFYVGALVTTIGYGNIAPRTVAGQALSVLYALFGIPLVLAILSQFGRTLTNLVSDWWQKYRQRVKKARSRIWNKAKKAPLTHTRRNTIIELEDGHPARDLISVADEGDLEELEESRTIPVWLALLICILWICACAALFCIWEKKWTYFTSLYFFFISLSTIGLGDIIPDHPRMLILMFWLVIIGLSIVSMLLSVIQIKMEEWLYNLMIRMQKEYQKALETGDMMDRSQILEKMMDNQPWYLKNFGPHLMNDKQADALERKAEKYDRVMREVNNKNIQTEGPIFDTREAQCEKANLQSMACSPKSESLKDLKNMETQWNRHSSISSSSDCFTTCDEVTESLAVPELEKELLLEKAQLISECEQTSEAALNSVGAQTSLAPEFVPKKPVQSSESCSQTEIAQFQIDEIKLRLHSIQEKRAKAAEANAISKAALLLEMLEKETQCDILDAALMDPEIFAEVEHEVKHGNLADVSVKKSEAGVGTESGFMRDQGCRTDSSMGMWCRGTQAGLPMHRDMCISTSRSEDSQSDSPKIGTPQRDQTTLTDSGIMMARTSATGSSSPILLPAAVAIQCTPDMLDHATHTESAICQSRSMETLPVRIDTETREVQTAKEVQDEGTDVHGIFVATTCGTQSEIPDSEDRSMITDIPKMRDRSMETINVPSSTQIECTQTDWPGDTGTANGPSMSFMTTSGPMSMSYSASVMLSISTQCSPPDSPNSTLRAYGRSSTSGVDDGSSIDSNGQRKSLQRQEVIIQTDDSYLKIARRLDDYRSNNNKNSLLPVCAASPMSPGASPGRDAGTDRPSERRDGHSTNYIPWNKPAKKEMIPMKIPFRLPQRLPIYKEGKKARSTSPRKGRGPAHERGIPNPATSLRTPVRIIRQYSLCQDPV
ncbi:unnamed protein product, partial [Mesorhabditis spiculigera]